MSDIEIVDLGAKPPLGVVPKKMHAFAVRQDRFGQPKDAWKREVLDIPLQPAWGALLAIPAGAVILAVTAALLAALPALNARPARALRAL